MDGVAVFHRMHERNPGVGITLGDQRDFRQGSHVKAAHSGVMDRIQNLGSRIGLDGV